MKKYILIVLLLIFHKVSAQKPTIRFNRLLPGDGLSHSLVSSVIQDRNGFMWFGTMDGLNKYDGYSFTTYKSDPFNSNSLSHNNILDMIFDREGNLWIGSWGGFTMYDTQKEVFVQYKKNSQDPDAIPNDLISSVLEDHLGNIWLGSADGLILFDRKNKKFTSYKHDKNNPESIGDDYVRDIFLDDQKQLWVGTYKGGLNLFDYKTGKFKRYLHDPSDPSSIGNNCVYSIFQDRSKRMWIASHNTGFDLFDRKNEKFIHYRHEPSNSNSLVHNAVSCFGEDIDGNLWVGTENGGLSIFNYDKNTFRSFKKDEIDNTTLANNSIYSIYRDKTGNMWVGTHAGGVNYLSLESSKFHHYKHNSSPASISHNIIMCFYEDSRNNLWIGTDGGGVNLFDRKNKTFTSFRNDSTNSNSIAGNYILSIAEDADHKIWIGTWGDGISVYDPDKKTFKNYKNNPAEPGSLSTNNIWYLYRAKNNEMWIGTYRGSGLDVYNKETDSFRSFSHDPRNPKGLNNNYINSIFEDKRGNFWIGTRGGGLNQYHKADNTFTAFTKGSAKGSISSNNVDVLFEDSRGNFWLGTDMGLNLMDRDKKTFTTFTSRDGLPSNIICGITEDKKGCLWISTINGIARFNYKEKTFTCYTVADGLQSQEFKPHAYLHSASGIMYFGGINGFNEFHPDSLTRSEYNFPLHFTDFRIFNKPIHVGDSAGGKLILTKALSLTDKIELSHEQSFFSFEFATLNYTSQKNRYAYMLEGFDKEWNYSGARRFATYTDVPPGTYTFMVRAFSGDDEKNVKEKSITVIVNPPYWRTWWFESLSALTAVAIGFTFYSARMRTIRRQREALETLVKERTYDLHLAAQEIKSQRDSLKMVNEHVMSSINYAKSIQKAILTPAEKIESTVSDSFIIYKPKDVVSGDFYWFSHLPKKDINLLFRVENIIKSDQRFIAAVDCTGHGVSGAFMSIIGNNLLNEIVNQKYIFDPASILESLDYGLKIAINPSGDSLAGMDVCLCRLEEEGEEIKVSFAGARRPLYYVVKGTTEVCKINGDIISIGSDFKKGRVFTTHEILLPKGSLLYLTSDGYADQNDPFNNKIGSNRLKELIESFCSLSLRDQKMMFENALEEHMQGVEQRDDITIVGVRI
jgi:ligand-binding sensor domain-containing protein/serine phosphatase RsbU (regulator of sigma subunit)